jgi:hypothetical protein
MERLKDAFRKLTATHVLLFLISVGLTMNWVELHGINKSLVKVSRSLIGMDVDLTTPIDVNIPNAVDVNTDH